ncbi:MAG: phosphate ABC transporter substrate-binding protein [Acidobacteria bacterium]|nr:phosphate ABC transporter substrate-binding protein [Acidobacteriota bacterium]
MKKTTLIALLTLALAAGLLFGAKMLQIKGSDTMVNLVQILAEEYMAKNPGAAIAVLGGGSGTGITGLINQTCDIANSSREWKPKETDQAWDKGVTPRPFIIAVDGLSVIVNEKNPIDQLTMAQVGALYRGEIKNWKAVGEFAKPVSLYGRQSNSGTYVFMQEFVLGNKNYSTDMKEMNGNAQIIEGVLQDEGAVGYVGVGYLFDETGKVRKGLKVLKISKEPNGPGFMPTDKAATNGKPKGDAAKLLAWIVSPEGQAIVEREGFFTVGEGKYKASNDKNFK